MVIFCDKCTQTNEGSNGLSNKLNYRVIAASSQMVFLNEAPVFTTRLTGRDAEISQRL